MIDKCMDFKDPACRIQDNMDIMEVGYWRNTYLELCYCHVTGKTFSTRTARDLGTNIMGYTEFLTFHINMLQCYVQLP